VIRYIDGKSGAAKFAAPDFLRSESETNPLRKLRNPAALRGIGHYIDGGPEKRANFGDSSRKK